MLNVRDGAEGLTLTTAKNIIMFDPPGVISSQKYNQAISRVMRLGQTENVTIYELYAKGTYEDLLFTKSNEITKFLPNHTADLVLTQVYLQFNTKISHQSQNKKIRYSS